MGDSSNSPQELLSFDPAAVVLRAIKEDKEDTSRTNTNTNTNINTDKISNRNRNRIRSGRLQELQLFASNLTEYINRALAGNVKIKREEDSSFDIYNADVDVDVDVGEYAIGGIGVDDYGYAGERGNDHDNGDNDNDIDNANDDAPNPDSRFLTPTLTGRKRPRIQISQDQILTQTEKETQEQEMHSQLQPQPQPQPRQSMYVNILPAACESEDKGYKGDRLPNGQKHGTGKMIYSTAHSKLHILTNHCCNIHTYEGQWKHDKRHGKGRAVMFNGDVYDGEWDEDACTGIGMVNIYDTGDEYCGQFMNGLAHGHGVYKYSNGDVYEGELKNEKFCGLGKLVYADGNVYTGEFEDDLPHGKGSFAYLNGDMYTGAFKDGLKHGMGKTVYAYHDSDSDSKSSDNTCTRTGTKKQYYTMGQYKNDQENGYVTCVEKWGTYVGSVVDDRKCGVGKLTFPNGDVYVGQFEDDMLHGRGSMTYASSGRVKKGIWFNGQHKVKSMVIHESNEHLFPADDVQGDQGDENIVELSDTENNHSQTVFSFEGYNLDVDKSYFELADMRDLELWQPHFEWS